MNTKPNVVILKVGTKSVWHTPSWLPAIATACSKLREADHCVLIVTSGAVFAGIERMQAEGYQDPVHVLGKAVLAGLGTLPLITAWQEAFQSTPVAPCWVTHTNLRDVGDSTSLTQNLLTVAQHNAGVVLINEADLINDTEIRLWSRKRGENDRLATGLTLLLQKHMDIRCVFFGTEAGGVYNKDPRNAEATKISSLSYAGYDKEKILVHVAPSFADGDVPLNDIEAKIAAGFECHRSGVEKVVIGDPRDIANAVLQADFSDFTRLVP
jgi:glutamate 5-kinase